MGELKQTDISKRLRNIAADWGNFTFSPISQKEMLAAAEEIERYYTGMLNWKASAEAHSTPPVPDKETVKDAERWRMLEKVLRTYLPGHGYSRRIKVVEISTMYGVETNVGNLAKLIDAAITTAKEESRGCTHNCNQGRNCTCG